MYRSNDGEPEWTAEEGMTPGPTLDQYVDDDEPPEEDDNEDAPDEELIGEVD